MMTTHTDSSVVQANCTLARRFFAEQDRLQGGPAEELCAPEYRACLGGTPPMDRAGHEAFAKSFYAAFKGIHHTIVDVFGSEDRVAVRFVLEGVHTGAFFGVPPSGRPITVAANVILHIENGKVAKVFGIIDDSGLFRQMGAQ
jgi:predicted ester cyclase